jgi:hypothetical protein
MTTRWLLAKYMGDMRRREPVNIGVIVISEHGTLARFIAEKEDGSIDGRSARPMNSPVVYRQWVRHWRQLLERQEVSEILHVASHGWTDENYFLEAGGELLLDGGKVDPQDLLDDLYTSVVDDTPDPTRESIGQLAERVMADLTPVLSRPIHRESLIRVRHDDKVDELRFDYRYNNGVPHLMQRVSLAFGDARSWDRVHAAAWSFAEVRNASEPDLRDAQFIALYKPREPDATLDQQLGQLERLGAHTVDVSVPDQATETLVELLDH